MLVNLWREDSLSTVVASSTYIGPGPLPKYQAGREPTTAGKFEGGQLVQAILTKAVFACEKPWGDVILGSTMTSALPSSGLGLVAPIWQPLPDASVLFACAGLLSIKEEIRTLCALTPAWYRSSWLTSREPREVCLALISLLLVSLPG